MELPFTVVFEPPSQSELRTVLRMRGIWIAALIVALAIGTTLFLTHVGHADSVSAAALVDLDLRSQPPGAAAWLDGGQLGRTPQHIQVAPGAHSVVLKGPEALEAPYVLQVDAETGAVLNPVLWRRQPPVLRLRPALPGAQLSDVRFLADGQLALTIDVLSGRQLQAWRLEPRTGGLSQLAGDVAAVRLSVAPDDSRIAYVGYDVGPPLAPWTASGAPRPAVVWLEGGPVAYGRTGWRAPLVDREELRDASWSPLVDRLLVVGDAPQSAAAVRTRVWLVDAATLEARELLTLPSEVVPGSMLWSPDGTRVVFLAHSGLLNALCMLDVNGGFRYLADLELTNGQPLAYPAAAWSNDGQRLVFVAPRQGPSGAAVPWLQPDSRQALYVATTSDAAPTLLGEADIDGVTWREDGQLLGASRQNTDGRLDLRLAGAGSSTHLVDLPLRPARGYASGWDVAHARVLIANPTSSGGAEFWLALLGLEDHE